MSSKFKGSTFQVGDKVIRKAPTSSYNEPNDGIGMFNGREYIVNGIDGLGGLSLEGCKYKYSQAHFELVQPKQFTKADLKDGMKVVFRSGAERVYYNGVFYEKSGKSLDWTSTSDDFNNDLTFGYGESANIVEVYERDGTLLWKREEKSQQEIEYEKLKEQVDVMTKQMIALGKTIGK